MPGAGARRGRGSPGRGSRMTDMELEVTLALCSDRPERLARRIAAVDEVAGCRLVAETALCLRDTYLDTPDRRLGSAGAALRIRRSEDRTRIAVKTRGRTLEGGGLDRLEVEREGDLAGWAEIRARLQSLGVGLEEEGPGDEEPAALSGDRSGWGTPAEVAARTGLEVIQDRETLRRPARVVSAGGGRVAELVVDRVVFRPGGRPVVHYELELEAVGAGDRKAVQSAASELRRRFRGRLRPWDHPKLATGEALERLVRADRLGELVTAGGTLRPAAYDALDDLLAGGTGTGPGS